MPPAAAHAQLGKSTLFEPAEPLFCFFRGFSPIAVGDDSGVNIQIPAEVHQFQYIVKIDKRLPRRKTDTGNTGNCHLPNDLFCPAKLHFIITWNVTYSHTMGASDIAAGRISEGYFSH
jgi:hypothetical protein